MAKKIKTRVQMVSFVNLSFPVFHLPVSWDIEIDGELKDHNIVSVTMLSDRTMYTGIDGNSIGNSQYVGYPSSVISATICSGLDGQVLALLWEGLKMYTVIPESYILQDDDDQIGIEPGELMATWQV